MATHHRRTGLPRRLLNSIVEPSVRYRGISGAVSPTLIGVDAVFDNWDDWDKVEFRKLYEAKKITRIVMTTRLFRFRWDSPNAARVVPCFARLCSRRPSTVPKRRSHFLHSKDRSAFSRLSTVSHFTVANGVCLFETTTQDSTSFRTSSTCLSAIPRSLSTLRFLIS